jgi:hypothetical protein
MPAAISHIAETLRQGGASQISHGSDIGLEPLCGCASQGLDSALFQRPLRDELGGLENRNAGNAHNLGGIRVAVQV